MCKTVEYCRYSGLSAAMIMTLWRDGEEVAGDDITVLGVTRLCYNGQHRGDLMLSRYLVPCSLYTNSS